MAVGRVQGGVAAAVLGIADCGGATVTGIGQGHAVAEVVVHACGAGDAYTAAVVATAFAHTDIGTERDRAGSAAQRHAHRQQVLGIGTAQRTFFGTQCGEAEVHRAPGVVVAHLVLLGGTGAIVEVTHRAGHVQRAPATAERLVQGQLELAALAAAGARIDAAIIGVACVQRILQAVEAFSGIAVCGQGQVGAGLADHVAVAQAHAGAGAVAVMIERGTGMGDIGGEGTQRRGHADTVQQRQVAIAQRAAAVQGQLVADAALVGALHQPRLIAQLLVADLAGSDGIAGYAGAQHLRHRTERNLELAAAAIGFDHAHFQVAAVTGRVQVVDHEVARRHRGRIDQLLVLADFDACIGLGDATHDRRVTAQRIGQHAIVAGQAGTAVADRIEQLATGVGLTQGEHAAHLRNTALRIGGDALPMTAVAFVPGQVGIVAELPAAQVQAGVEAQVGAAVAVATVGAAVTVDRIEAVANETGIDAAVPQRRIDVASGFAAHERLRDAEVVAQVAAVIGTVGVGHALLHRHAGALVQRCGRILLEQDRFAVHAQLFQRRHIQAGIDTALRIGLELQVAAALPCAVDVDVDAIVAGNHRVAIGEGCQVDLLGLARQEAGIELRLFRRTRRCRTALRHQRLFAEIGRCSQCPSWAGDASSQQAKRLMDRQCQSVSDHTDIPSIRRTAAVAGCAGQWPARRFQPPVADRRIVCSTRPP
ncbi:hypothetical protein D3C72_937600 [compost metagenome]